MRKIIIVLFLLSGYAPCLAQIGIIEPGKSYLNTGLDTLFYMPKQKVIEFKMLQTNYTISLEKIEKLTELTLNYQKRISLADSTIALNRIESDIWFSKLQANDLALEEQRKLNIQLKDDKARIRRSRIYYFVGGVLATSIVFVAVK